MFDRAAVARRLEANVEPGHFAALMASAWSALSARGVCRPLSPHLAARSIGIGGATLGGSCKTPFALAFAEALAARGLDVGFVGHAYRARPCRARIVTPHDDVREVGDDTLLAARRLARCGVEVVTGPARRDAIALATRRARSLVVDGLLQTRPTRLARAILVLDASSPWGNGRCPPAGDLRAPRRALLSAADAVVLVRDQKQAPSWPFERPDMSTALSFFDVPARLDYAIDAHGRGIPIGDLVRVPVGLVSTIARPGRVLEVLARRGVLPVATVAFADHHRPTLAELARAAAPHAWVNAWLTTEKCATKLPSSIGGAPLLVLKHELVLPETLLDWVAGGPVRPPSLATQSAIE